MKFLSSLVVALSVTIASAQSDRPSSPALPVPAERALELRLKLPFAAGAEHLCCQGVGGETSHHHGFQDEFAWDFDMPVGTPVHAAAHGRVVFVAEGYSEGGFEESMKSKANSIWIDHGGGALSSYVHLDRDSSLVRVGQLVSAGQAIARSGNSGYSVGPHLHFAVIDCLGKSLEASFLDADVPVEGSTYESKNNGADCTWWTADSRIPGDLFAGAGIRLAVAPRAHLWDPGASLRFAGECSGADEIVFFASAWRGGDTLFTRQVPVGKDGLFEFKLEPLELADLHGLARFRVALAPVDGDGNFKSSEMLGIHWMESASAQARSVHLPFSGDEPRSVSADEVFTVGRGKSQRDLQSVTVQLEKGQTVRACAGGRVLEILLASKAGIRKSASPRSASPRSACVRIDHGGGLEVLYAGLDPGSVTCVPGHVVAGGSALGTVGLHAATRACTLLLVVDGGRPAPLRFIGLESPSGRGLSKNGRDNALAFARDSALAPADFVDNGITVDVGASLPASTFHVGTRYLIRGTTTEPSGTVEFVIRRDGAKRDEVLTKVAADADGKFELEVVLPDSLKNKPYRYALTSYARESRGRVSPAVWRLLLAMR